VQSHKRLLWKFSQPQFLEICSVIFRCTLFSRSTVQSLLSITADCIASDTVSKNSGWTDVNTEPDSVTLFHFFNLILPNSQWREHISVVVLFSSPSSDPKATVMLSCWFPILQLKYSTQYYYSKPENQTSDSKSNNQSYSKHKVQTNFMPTKHNNIPTLPINNIII